MTEPTTRPRQSGHLVTAVLVCHDGAQWLPDVLDALAAQTDPPGRFVAADTGSTDGSAQLVTDALGPSTVVSLPRTTSFGTAVQAGLEAFDGVAPPGPDGEPVVEWVWLLHDDCAPDPDALEELLGRLEDSPSVWMVGPKVRGWDGVRLVEAGLTITPTGHVDTGFDGLERDQGQRDDVDEVLAVGTAGALIRRDIWDRLGGLDPAWSTYADDVDLGWRINAAGGRVVVASRAVVRHLRAQTMGRRASSAQPGSAAVLRRRSGMQVVLSNTSPWLVPVLLARYVVGGVLRAIGLLLLSRRPAQAGAELLAVLEVLTHPRVITTGRRDRARGRSVPHRELRRLFARTGSRWRFSPFRVGRLSDGRALAASSGGSGETGPVAEESESLTLEAGPLGRALRRPSVGLFVAMSVLALIAERHLLGGVVHGGRLLPAPKGASDLWSTYTSSFHPSGVGSSTPAPPSLAILALASTILLGNARLMVDLLVLGAVPLAALSAYTAARPLTSAARVRIWVAVAYSLLPAVTGAVAGGRLDVIVAAIALPQVIRVCVAAIQVEPGDFGWRRSLGAGLLFAVPVAFAPLLWLVAVPAFVVGIGLVELESDSSTLTIRRLIAAATILAVPFLVLVPWSFHLLGHPRLLISGTGLPEFYTAHSAPSGLSLALLRAGGAAQPPIWIGIPVVAAALLGLTRQSRVAIARVGVVLLVIGVAVAVGLTRGAGVTAGIAASRHWPGLVLLVAGAGALLTALVAAVGARPALREQSFGWRQPAAVVLVVLAVVSTVTLAGGWLIRGAGRPLSSSDSQVLPLFAQAELSVPTSPRALVLDASGRVISYALVRRPDGPVLGDADTSPRAGTPAAAHLATAVRDLVAGKAGAGAELAPFGIGYVVAPSASVSRVESALGRATTLMAVPAPGATVWRSTVATGELDLLGSAASATALAGGVPTQPVARVLRGTAGSTQVTVAPRTSPGLLVLAEPASRDWHATLNGSSLVGHTAYGWAQAFTVPAGGGRLSISFRGGSRDAWLWVELVIVLVVMGTILPTRRPDELEVAA